MVDFEIQVKALELLDELDANYLEVVLCPASDQKHSGHCVRVVQYQNAYWYREFCSMYSSARKGFKTRTRIKRRETRKALEKLANGENNSVYTERIIDFLRTYETITTRNFNR